MTPPEAKADSLVGATLADKYRIVRELGRGGMGVVYEAEHLGLGKRVAIKLMLEKYAEDGDAASRFKREALAASRIGNPHIIDISDLGIAPDGRMFVAMELLRGSSLADGIRKSGALAPERALEIMKQTLRAVGAAHAKGIIHRDLKPDNIFLVDHGDGRDFVKLLDFGISRAVDQAAEIAKTKLTTTGTVMGTPLYMAPEQAMGNPADARADVYALGVILYEMLSGAPPFTGVTLSLMLVKLLTEPPALLSELRPDVPAPIVAAVHRALEKEPEARFATCDAFLAALTGDSAKVSAQFALDNTIVPGDAVATASLRAASSSVAAARAPSTTSSGVGAVAAITAAPARRSGGLMIALAAVGGAIVVGGIAIALQLTRQSPEPPAATVAAPSMTPPSVTPPSVVPPSAAPPIDAGPPTTAIETPPPQSPPPSPPPSVPSKPSAPKKLGQVAAAPAAAPTAAPPAAHATTLDDVSAAIKRRDGKGCRAALASLASPPASDFRVASLHAVCEMVAGNCTGGLKEQQALNARDGTPVDSAKIIVELYCPVSQGNDPSERLHRLAKQLSMFTDFDCDQYIASARELAKAAQTDQDRRIAGSVLAQIATCYSHHDKCDVARKVLGEAQVFIPALATNELAAACR